LVEVRRRFDCAWFGVAASVRENDFGGGSALLLWWSVAASLRRLVWLMHRGYWPHCHWLRREVSRLLINKNMVVRWQCVTTYVGRQVSRLLIYKNMVASMQSET